jgi:hypothetical protein
MPPRITSLQGMVALRPMVGARVGAFSYLKEGRERCSKYSARS